MSYLLPPPLPAPVVVTKDVGGLVSDYRSRTEEYRAQNREVRLHECRSACTLALSLPNVCVFPDSLLKFHQAYNEITKEADLGISDELWQSYPAPVRARLGNLTRQYKVIRGDELIALGIRDCRSPRERILVAKARPAPVPPAQATSILANLENALTSVVGSPTPTPVQTRPIQEPTKAPLPSVPLPPEGGLQTTIDVPLPPPRPPFLAKATPEVPPFQRPIPGSQRILLPQFVSLASLR